MWRSSAAWRLACAIGGCLVLLAASAEMGAGVAMVHASGPGPCTVMTETDAAALAGAHSRATIALSRSTGTVGTRLTLRGSGWPAATEVRVDILISRAGRIWPGVSDVISAKTTNDGRFETAAFRAPEIASCISMKSLSSEGGTALFVAHTSANDVRASTIYTYLPSPHLTAAITSTSIPSGTAIALSGTHWPSKQVITLFAEIRPFTALSESESLQRVPGSTLTTSTDASGAFTLQYSLPKEPPETQVQIMAEATSAQYGNVLIPLYQTFEITPSVSPTLTLDRTSAEPGADVTVSGDHWLPGQLVQIEYCRGETELPGMPHRVVPCDPYVAHFLIRATVDPHGHFTIKTHLPVSIQPGAITLQARVPGDIFGLLVYAQGQPFTVLYPFALAHPRLAKLLAATPVVAGAALLLLAVGLFAVFIRRGRHAREGQ